MARRGDQGASWRDGGSVTDWPSQWPHRDQADKWPTLTPKPRWRPEHTRAVVACVRLRDPVVIRMFDTAAEAAQALETPRCSSRGCQGHHVALVTRPGVMVIRSRSQQQPTTLEQEFRRAGYKPIDDIENRSKYWATPPEFNQPLGAREMAPETRKALQDQLIGDGPNRAMEPHPNGLSGRIIDAINDGDEQLASALTDAWVAALPPEDTGTRTAL